MRNQLATSWNRSRAAAVIACGLLQSACSTVSPNYQNQRTFATPELAVQTLAEAARKGDTATLEAIFGPQGREVLSSGDPVADKNNREVFAVAVAEQWSLGRIDGNTKELIVGDEQWPFPIPLEKDANGWWFDTQAGKQEVLARRIGRDELAAIGVCRTYVIAQREYAGEGHDGTSPGLFAQKVRSDAGKHDGLHWEQTSDLDKPSPLGQFAAQASTEGYVAADRTSASPYYGYLFRILTRQGPDAAGGAKDYIVNGDMKDGFALIAYPAEYGNSGIMTFIVNQDGVVYETDLGKDTSKLAAAVTTYNPDGTFRRVE